MAHHYDNIQLYAKSSSVKSMELFRFLTENSIRYDIFKSPDNDTLAALNTWFVDENIEPIIFSDFPILTYVRVWGVDADGLITKGLTKHVIDVADLPADFITLSVKD